MRRAGRLAGVPGARVLGGVAQHAVRPRVRLLPLPHRTLHHRRTQAQGAGAQFTRKLIR